MRLSTTKKETSDHISPLLRGSKRGSNTPLIRETPPAGGGGFWYKIGFLLLTLQAAAFFLLPLPALAISKTQCDAWGIYCKGSGSLDLAGIIGYIWGALNVVFAMLATVATAALIYYGIIYIISQGEEDETRRAKKGIVYAILGIMIVGLAAWIVNAVLNL